MDEELILQIGNTRRRAADSLRDFLQGFAWDAFFTATFSRPANRGSLAISRTVKLLCESYAGRAFVAAEPFYLGNYHTHGLAYWERRKGQPAGWESVEQGWLKSSLARYGFSKVEVVRQADAATAYCAKYLTKELSDWEMFGDWPKRPLTNLGLQGKMGL